MSILWKSLSDELSKIAKTRYQKEFEAGRPSFAAPLDTEEGRRKMRSMLSAHGGGGYLDAPRTTGGQQHNMLDVHRQMLDKAYHSQATSHGAVRRHIPLLGPGMMNNKLFVPEDTGQLIRTVDEGHGAKALAATLHPSVAKRALLPPAPEDATIRHAILRHEIGERDTGNLYGGSTIAPNSGHLGVRPILEENQVLRGDAEAHRGVANVRQLHPDDRLTAKLIRQAGGTPDAPLALGGRQERAVNRMLERNVTKLSPGARGKSVLFHGLGANVPYVPRNVPSVRTIPAQLSDVKRAWNLGHEFDAAAGVHRLWDAAKRTYRFVRRGV